MNVTELLDALQQANAAYRAGSPIISDSEYDDMVNDLTRIDPDNPYLHTVEPEPVSGKTVKLPERMLSTQKAYTVEELNNWYKQVQKLAVDLRILSIEIRVTPKLDGFAAYDAGDFQATRGDGFEGTDITHAFKRGLATFRDEHTPNTVAGKGEIVVDKEYFAKYLAGEYENTRNVIAAVIKAGKLDTRIELAIAQGGVLFVPFTRLSGFQTNCFDNYLELVGVDELFDKITGRCPCDTDGIVIEVINDKLKEAMGSTNHHHRWQIAYKRNTEFHDCKVTGITWQTARTGRITPVVNIEPTRIGGVTVSNVTGHHAGNVMNSGIGEGAVVKVTRAGQVIPHIVEVIQHVPTSWPDQCPSCGGPTSMDGDMLFCGNTVSCPAQSSGRIEHFFKTIGVDGFGPAICDKLVAHYGNPTLLEICTGDGDPYGMGKYFGRAGISQGVANNLIDQIGRARMEPLEDWKFLAATGFTGIGRGVSEKILSRFTLSELSIATVQEIKAIDGVGDVLAETLHKSMDLFGYSLNLLAVIFNLTQTKGSTTSDSPIAGKTIVFTGTMVTGKRGDMEKQAKALGATVTSSVSAKTDYLVAGENVGANKTDAAKKHSVTVLSEQQYLEMVA